MKRLRFLYLFIFVLTVVLVAPPHVLTAPHFMYLRFPTYLEQMPPFLGFPWPLTFKIYHLVAVVLAIIGAINILGIMPYPKFNKLARLSSLAGFILSLLIVLFFLFIFMKVNIQISLIYTFYFLMFSAVNLSTFIALGSEKRKDA